MSAAPITAPVTFVSARDDAQKVATLWVVGELDEFTCDAFEAELERIVPLSRSLIVELSSCTFISSVALAALLRLRRRLPDRGIMIVTESAHMAKLIRVAGLDPLFPRFDNVVDALVAAAGDGPTSNPHPSGQMDSEGDGGAVVRRLVARHGSRRELRIPHEGELQRLEPVEPHAS